MLEIHCTGTPWEIGLEHGTKAASNIHDTIQFYTDLFLKKCKYTWPEACSKGEQFAPHIHEHYPHLETEMQGIAKGAGVTYEEILTLNVRSELFFGASLDGCTSVAWKTDSSSFVAQNWDWMVEQKKNLVLLQIDQPGKPVIQMLTETGMIGKIGLNSAGLGLCVNAIRCAGNDPARTPIHIMWRLILECSSVAEAVAAIQAYGCASSCHMLIADPCGNASVEVTHCTIEFIKPDARGRIFHSNHMLLPHPGTSPMAMNESRLRVERIREVADELQGEITKESIQSLLCDEKNFPCSINRAQEGESDAESVFSIVTDATNAEARVLLGRPSKPERIFMLQPRLMK